MDTDTKNKSSFSNDDDLDDIMDEVTEEELSALKKENLEGNVSNDYEYMTIIEDTRKTLVELLGDTNNTEDLEAGVTRMISEDIEGLGSLLDSRELIPEPLEEEDVEKEKIVDYRTLYPVKSQYSDYNQTPMLNQVAETDFKSVPSYVEMPQEKKFYCEYCPLNFTMRIYVVQHMKYFHQVDIGEDEMAQKRFDEPPAVIEPWNMIDMSTVCDVCNKIFTTNWGMIEHKTSVHDGIRFPCAHCEHIASSKRNLRGHINKKHPEKELPATYNTIKLTDEK